MDDPETKERIEETVRRILQESDMDEVTESKIRKQASQELGLDLSQTHFKAFVKQVVKAFLQEKQEEEEQQQQQDENHEEEEEEEEQGVSKGKEYDDEGDLIICKLSDKRRVTIQDFRGKTLVSMREYYKKDGKELPTSKGISLTEEQWSAFKKNVPAIEKAIKKMESRNIHVSQGVMSRHQMQSNWSCQPAHGPDTPMSSIQTT
ncbi:RNA polymerase II transcriptional coactivator KELP [Mucuna pruriens]|uniref:RNA polymerase II transcriptional coactivator KELP n=1 Tax=Mucuna pruriens TaxID=157652 RepID=A0A371G4G9_MUCPR|nr:RNA polymerase II transcriptional coactivator KELP [Mucuna pruriens]